MITIVLAAIMFAAATLQVLSGFGFALIVMPLVTLVIGLREAAPLVALAGVTLYTINVIRYRRGLIVRELLPLAVASALGIPVGIWALVSVPEAIIRPVLGGVLIVYALYTIVRPAMPPLCSPRWGYLAGFLAGCLGGAYNTPGPPVVVYASLRQWPKDEFRAVLQSLFLVNGSLVVLSHAMTHHLTAQVLTTYAACVPALLLGIAAGALLDSKVNQARFRQLVSGLILLTGLSLVITL